MTTNKPLPVIITIWRITLTLAAALLAMLTSVLFKIGSNIWFIATACWIIIYLTAYLAYLPLLYKRTSFSLTGDKITLSTGVLFNRVTLVPLESIQYTSVSQSLFARVFGVASVIIAAPGAKMIIAGLKMADAATLARVLRE